MWVFDGEDWSEEGTAPKRVIPSLNQPADFYPELQIIDLQIVPTPREREYPPMPIP
ncbi:MAG TPA: hypothetical protein VHL58_08280 [Thermoanaerobaculia bacterium]|nr:hypothetical protein [Thermoanaerobaculia bacterium]